MIIKVATDFTEIPGARYESQGPNSGEQFRNEILYPKFIECQKNNEELIVDLDGGYGYGSSFLEESFGGLVRKLYEDKYKDIKNVRDIKIISYDNPIWVDKIAGYIESALSSLKKGEK